MFLPLNERTIRTAVVVVVVVVVMISKVWCLGQPSVAVVIVHYSRMKYVALFVAVVVVVFVVKTNENVSLKFVLL